MKDQVLNEADLMALKIRIGYQYGMPEYISERLKGSTEAEVTADAIKLAQGFYKMNRVNKSARNYTEEVYSKYREAAEREAKNLNSKEAILHKGLSKAVRNIEKNMAEEWMIKGRSDK